MGKRGGTQPNHLPGRHVVMPAPFSWLAPRRRTAPTELLGRRPQYVGRHRASEKPSYKVA